MKVYIAFGIKENASGGGNQFLKALKGHFQSRQAMAEDPRMADAILFNSYQFIPEVMKLKKKLGVGPALIHRIDGPIRDYNHPGDKRDYVTNSANRFLADATIFQSKWSRKMNYRRGLRAKPLEAVILNAPDPDIFNENGKTPFSMDGKTRIIAASWSANRNKGFETYKWLDDNLDFSRFEMAFVGNSPIEFRNIKTFPPMNSHALADMMKRHDIFLTASKCDPCSNSLIEAMHCGLPAVALQDGGHPEIIGGGGELFTGTDSLLTAIDRVTARYPEYKKSIKLPSMEEIGDKYLAFIGETVERTRQVRIEFGIMQMLAVKFSILRWRCSEKAGGIFRRIAPAGR